MKATKNGLPYVSVIFNALFSVLAYMGIQKGSGRVFGWFANMTAVAGLMTWFGISFTYLRFHAGMKAQGRDRTKLPYHTRFQPYAAYYSGAFSLLICIVSALRLSCHFFRR